MKRSLVVALLVLIFAFPAFAKPHNDKSPDKCSDLWIAVNDTLGNADNYSILGSDPVRMRVSFVVVGGLFPATNVIYLTPKEKKCELNVNMGFTGNDDEFALRSRVHRSLKKLQEAKPPISAKSEGNM